MLKYALIFNDIVANIIKEDPFKGQFEPELEWIPFDDVSVMCEVGWRYLRDKNKFERIRESIEVEKTLLLAKVNMISDEKYNTLINGYPISEISTFYRQELEANRFISGDKRTPFLSKIAKKRGLTIEEIVQRVLYKAEILADYMAEPISQRQLFEDQILAASTYEQLDELEKEVNQWRGGN